MMKHLVTVTPVAQLRLLRMGINLFDGSKKTAHQRETIVRVAKEALAERAKGQAQVAEINARRAL